MSLDISTYNVESDWRMPGDGISCRSRFPASFFRRVAQYCPRYCGRRIRDIVAGLKPGPTTGTPMPHWPARARHQACSPPIGESVSSFAVGALYRHNDLSSARRGQTQGLIHDLRRTLPDEHASSANAKKLARACHAYTYLRTSVLSIPRLLKSLSYIELTGPLAAERTRMSCKAAGGFRLLPIRKQLHEKRR